MGMWGRRKRTVTHMQRAVWWPVWGLGVVAMVPDHAIKVGGGLAPTPRWRERPEE